MSVKWFTRHLERDREKAIALHLLHEKGETTLVVPEFGLLEILNAIQYSDRTDVKEARRAVDVLEGAGLEVVPLDWDLLRESAAIAWSSGIAIYDAVYVALAERTGHPFVTADERLVRKLGGHRQVMRLQDLDLS